MRQSLGKGAFFTLPSPLIACSTTVEFTVSCGLDDFPGLISL